MLFTKGCTLLALLGVSHAFQVLPLQTRLVSSSTSTNTKLHVSMPNIDTSAIQVPKIDTSNIQVPSIDSEALDSVKETLGSVKDVYAEQLGPPTQEALKKLQTADPTDILTPEAKSKAISGIEKIKSNWATQTKDLPDFGKKGVGDDLKASVIDATKKLQDHAATSDNYSEQRAKLDLIKENFGKMGSGGIKGVQPPSLQMDANVQEKLNLIKGNLQSNPTGDFGNALNKAKESASNVMTTQPDVLSMPAMEQGSSSSEAAVEGASTVSLLPPDLAESIKSSFVANAVDMPEDLMVVEHEHHVDAMHSSALSLASSHVASEPMMVGAAALAVAMFAALSAMQAKQMS